MIKRNVVSKLHILKKVRWTLTTKDALTIYRSSLLPYFDQGDIFYSSASKSSLQSLQTLQNKALRIVYSKKHWKGTHQAHIKSKLLYLNQRRTTSLLKYAHTQSYNPDNLKKINARTLRSSQKTQLKAQLAKNTKFEKSFVYQAVTQWNGLSQETKSIRNFKLFKTRIKCEMLQNNINFPE